MVFDIHRSGGIGRLDYFEMAGIQAGVVGQAEVSGLPAGPTAFGNAMQAPSTWSYVWVALAVIYLVGIYLGMIRITRVGA